MVRKLPRFLSRTEVAEMFDVSKENQRDNLLLKCLYYLGLRNSEAQGLRSEHADIQGRAVKVARSGKERVVPMPGAFAEELSLFIAGREGYVFPGNSSGRISDRHIRRVVKEYAVKAGVRSPEEVHPHTLRHSYAAHLQSQGVPLPTIQRILGLEKAGSASIYSSISMERARDWVEKAFAGSH